MLLFVSPEVCVAVRDSYRAGKCTLQDDPRVLQAPNWDDKKRDWRTGVYRSGWIYSSIHSCEQHNYIIEIWDLLVTDSQSCTILDPIHILWHSRRVLKYQGCPVIFNFIYYMLYNQFLWWASLNTRDRDVNFVQGLCKDLITVFCLIEDIIASQKTIWTNHTSHGWPRRSQTIKIALGQFFDIVE